METGFLHLHSVLRWVLLLLLLASILKAFAGWQSNKAFTPGDRKVWLFTLIAAHVNLLIGLYLVSFGRYGFTKLPEGVSVMKDKFYRFFLVEHPVGMLVAIVLITMGYGMAKKAVPDQTKFKKAFILFLVALLVILATIPWPFREIVGRPWVS